MAICVTRVAGGELSNVLEDVARLRIEVFREWPYLYDGTIEYERNYLNKFAASPGAVVVLALDENVIVGASTASPLADHFEDFAQPFRAQNLNVDDFFYFGESVLLPNYRGQGIGGRFFDERERSAREQGFAKAVFCSVIRSPDDPREPKGYKPLNSFWQRRGYECVEHLAGTFAWKEIGQDVETEHPMQFWMKELV